MSIKSEVAKSTSYLRSARRAILGRGGEISATAGLKDLPEAIYKIPADASLAYRSDDSVAYQKIVPSGAEEYAQVAKVGGMTYKIETKLLDTKVTELVSEGANLIPFPYLLKSGTQNGTTYTIGDDGSITLDTTPTSGFMLTIAEWKNGKVFNGTYTISTGVSVPTGTNLSLHGESGTLTILSTGSSRTLAINGTYSYLKMWVSIDGIFSNIKLYPMLNHGSTAAPYKPYRVDAVDTFPVSAELRAFLEQYGYGRGVSGYPNYIDFERKVFVQNTYRVVFDGTENWEKSDTMTADIWRNYCPLPYKSNNDNVNAITPSICTHYDATTSGNTYSRAQGFSINSRSLYAYDNNYTDKNLSLWKSHLAELYAAGTPLIVEYALAEPIEIDISAYLTDDNFIKVEGSGTIKAVNEHEQDAPSTINYIEKVG